MNTIKSLGFVGLAAAGLFASQAFATTCPTAPVTGQQTQGSPVCIAPYGLDGSGTGLVNILDTFNATTNPHGIVKSGPTYNPYTQQAVPSSFWSIGATGASENKIVLELAGNANTNTFGIFDPTNPSNFLQLFSGPASAGWTTTLINTGSGNYTATYFDAGGIFKGQSSVHFGVTNLFGYYLGAASNTPTFYSDPKLNQDPGSTYANGTPHMVAYDGNNKTVLKTGNTSGTFLSNEWLLAWEDTAFANSDLDYNDFVVLVESVHPVPEPAVLGMFGLGVLLLGGFAALRRRGWKA
ncbi:MAG TPA: DUF4114 domain-containing protein [Rhodanobacteraceae bacterium]|nr:DUF4114 domain-containing protein [Rhodanobacteraceae bacterium]